mmetsp:Transcript_12468/g.17810  ORF Transcript_12468/g.17810 Transcript_12468/m.17810 type:complete len:143 (+) Transcript_12468:324-752(+)
MKTFNLKPRMEETFGIIIQNIHQRIHGNDDAGDTSDKGCILPPPSNCCSPCTTNNSIILENLVSQGNERTIFLLGVVLGIALAYTTMWFISSSNHRLWYQVESIILRPLLRMKEKLKGIYPHQQQHQHQQHQQQQYQQQIQK